MIVDSQDPKYGTVHFEKIPDTRIILNDLNEIPL